MSAKGSNLGPPAQLSLSNWAHSITRIHSDHSNRWTRLRFLQPAEFDSLPAWIESTCTEQILVEVHGCLSTVGNAETRLRKFHQLMSALEPEYAVFAAMPNLLSGGACIEYGQIKWG